MSKQEVYDRDGGVCFYCGKSLTLAEATHEHLLSQVHAGPKNNFNTTIACQPCNNEAGAKSIVDKVAIRERKLFNKQPGTKTTVFSMGEIRVETTEVTK